LFETSIVVTAPPYRPGKGMKEEGGALDDAVAQT